VARPNGPVRGVPAEREGVHVDARGTICAHLKCSTRHEKRERGVKNGETRTAPAMFIGGAIINEKLLCSVRCATRAFTLVEYSLEPAISGPALCSMSKMPSSDVTNEAMQLVQLPTIRIK
jgi:hypothetical protein